MIRIYYTKSSYVEFSPYLFGIQTALTKSGDEIHLIRYLVGGDYRVKGAGYRDLHLSEDRVNSYLNKGFTYVDTIYRDYRTNNKVPLEGGTLRICRDLEFFLIGIAAYYLLSEFVFN